MDTRITALKAALKAVPTNPGAAERHLQPLAEELPAATKRRSLSRKQQLVVYRKHHFHCCYCGRATVLHAALEYLSAMFPKMLSYHPNWKRSATHPLFPDITATCDHVVPLSRGGEHDPDKIVTATGKHEPDNIVTADGKHEPRNIITACARCQYMKGDWLLEELGWRKREITDSEWDGLTGLFFTAFKASPVPDKNISAWIKELECQER